MTKMFRYALLMVVSLFAVSANSAPMAYSVNSDSGTTNADSLYLIDLATGADQRRGPLISGAETRLDTEGLAFAPDGTLWGIDDDSRTLFPINTVSGAINPLNEILFAGFPPSGNDFGMTFACDSSLYVTSVSTRTLYRLDLGGGSVTVGGSGALGVNIYAIAAIGNPTELYGLGNGSGSGSPNLYSIDIVTGVATPIGPLGAEAEEYSEGGLSFDSNGALWAITDRRLSGNQPSQILRIDVNTGTATLVSSTSEVGFESLAIAPPGDCGDVGVDDDEYARIPTLSVAGNLLAILVLLLTGMTILHRRFS